MAGPTLTNLLQTAGIAPGQTVGKQTETKKKDSETPKVVIDGDDGEAAKSTSEAAAKHAKKQSAKESSKGGEGGSQVKRKRVKLKNFAEREVQKEVGGKETKKSDKTQKSDQARFKGGETKEGGEAHESFLERTVEGAQAKVSLGLKKAAGRLMEQSRFTQSSVKYESARQAQNNGAQAGLTKGGQQKWMLNNLCTMLNICVEQHTGGKAGEAFDSRRDTRLIYMALRGLRDGNQKPEVASTPSAGRGMARGEYEAKQKKAQLIFANIIEPPVRPESMPEYCEVA